MQSLLFWNGVFCVVDDPFRMYELGDRAITVEWVQEPYPELHDLLISLHAYLQHHPFPGFIESVPAYVSLTVFFDPLDPQLCYLAEDLGVANWVKRHFMLLLSHLETVSIPRQLVTIPVCYDAAFGPDQQAVADHCGLSIKDVIDIHMSIVYRVYMIGFVPGFPYLGMTDLRLEVPRKSSPTMQVAPGSVALAGRQTGIYPQAVPGGWQIIGRTPVRMFDSRESNPFLLKPGMDVKFESIDRDAFEKLSCL